MTKKKRLSGPELLEAWRKKEETLRMEREIARAAKLKTISHECMNCMHSWYRLVEPTGCFTEASEFCGCRLHVKMVDPHATCPQFDVDCPGREE